VTLIITYFTIQQWIIKRETQLTLDIVVKVRNYFLKKTTFDVALKYKKDLHGTYLPYPNIHVFIKTVEF
jgi:hypothetical protein